MQRVVVNGCFSDFLPVLSGVPQASKLGPLLFLFYIEDIMQSVSTSKMKLFADDGKLYGPSSSPFEFSLLKNDLENVFNWAKNSQLNIALEKSAVLHYGRNNLKWNYVIDRQHDHTKF